MESRLRTKYGDELVDRALKRITDHGVSETSYGWRVSADEELGDDITRNAYWPKESDRTPFGWWCRCRWGRSHRMCSHVLAVRLTIAKEHFGLDFE